MGVPILGILKFPPRNLETKWHLGAGLVAKHKIYYKGEGGSFPQIQAVMSLVTLCLPMACPCTRMFKLCTNQFVVWFVQACVSK